MDYTLFETKEPNKKVLWRPGNGRVLAPDIPSYQPLLHIVRTVHVQDALQTCLERGMRPKPILAKSILNSRRLETSSHPCKNMKVLWFGTRPPPIPGKEEVQDWYGNVQFALPADILHRWKFYYLVEMETTTKHTTSRLLITNTDYSGVLPPYNPHVNGGPWHVNSNGQFVLADCSRFNHEGINKNGHFLEFMIEATPKGQRGLLDESVITFRNHSGAISTQGYIGCHRSRMTNQRCPSPLTSAAASRMFFDQHQRIASVSLVATPRLSEDAEYYRKCYFMMINNAFPSCQSHFSPDQNPLLLSIRPPPIPREPHFLQTHFPNPPNPYPMATIEQISAGLFQQVGNNSRLFTHQSIQTSWGENGESWRLQETTNHHRMQYPKGKTSWGEREEHLRRQREERRRLQQAGHDPKCFTQQSIQASWGENGERWRRQQTSNRHRMQDSKGKASWGEREEHLRREKEENQRPQQAGLDPRVYAQQNMPPLPSSLEGVGEQRLNWYAWMGSLNYYFRGVLTWFWGQEHCHDVPQIPGWQTPQQHHRHQQQRWNSQRIHNNFQFNTLM